MGLCESRERTDPEAGGGQQQNAPPAPVLPDEMVAAAVGAPQMLAASEGAVTSSNVSSRESALHAFLQSAQQRNPGPNWPGPAPSGPPGGDDQFSTMLEVLRESLQVPVARISLLNTGERAMYWNSGSGVHANEIMVVADTLKDARFKSTQFVPWPPLTRFYASASVVNSHGAVMGSLEVLDNKPRAFQPGSLDMLRSFAGMVAKEMEKGKEGANKHQEKVDTALLVRKHTVRALSRFSEPVVLCNMMAPAWPILYVNDRFVYTTGITERVCLYSGFWDLFSTISGGDSMARFTRGIEERQPFVITVSGGHCSSVFLEFRPATSYHLTSVNPNIGEEEFGKGIDLSIVESSNAGLYFAVVKQSIQPPAHQRLALAEERSLQARWVEEEQQNLTVYNSRISSSGGVQAGSVGSSGAHANSAGSGGHHHVGSGSGTLISPFQQPPLPPMRMPSDLPTPARNTPQQSGEADLWPGSSSALTTRSTLSMRSQSDAAAQNAAFNMAMQLQRHRLGATPSLQPPREEDNPESPARGSLDGGRPDSGNREDPVMEAVPARTSIDQIPESLRGIKLGKLLGRGGFGEVYKANWRGAEVAVKVIRTWVDSESASVTGPMLEGLLSKSLMHPCIVQSFEAEVRTTTAPPGFEPDGSPRSQVHEGQVFQEVWIVQQYCNHGTLSDAIERGWLRHGGRDGPPNMRHILQTALEVASALVYLHRHDVLHGDLTAANVLLVGTRHRERNSRSFQAKVADFGLSRFMEAAQLTTATFGTVSHMPLELIAHGRLSKAVDVYSMGVLLHEMYMGRRAWAGRSIVQILFARTEEKQQLALSMDAPAAYKKLVESCLLEDSTQRPNFDEVVKQLEGLLEAEGGMDSAATSANVSLSYTSANVSLV